MSYTYHIQIISRDTVAVKIYDAAHNPISEASGSFISEHLSKIRELHEKVRKAKSSEAIEADEIGRLLFNSLLDDKLRSNFLNCYQNIQNNNALRIELEADERRLPDIVSLPWEFLCKPADEDGGIIRFASDSKMIFSRWRAQGNIPKPIPLKAGEDLRIVLAVAAPSDLGKVRYEEVLNTIKKLAQTERIGLSEFVNSATRKSIDEALKKNPHIFHFIGHGDMKDGGQIALVNDFGTAEWIPADKFGELFNRHQPSVVFLQSCESGALSASEAYTGIASRVVQQQIPAVIAMQYEVSNATACDFASEFYRCLSKGNPADLAAQEARRHIELQSSGNTRDFATPVLFMRVQEGEVFQREIPNPSEVTGLIEEARCQEKKTNPAYDQAIKKWLVVQHIDPDYPDAVSEIERLSKLIEQNATFTKINNELLRRMRDILPIYKPLAAYVKRMAKEGTDEDGEIFLNVMNQFLENNISGQEFIEIWKQFENKPSPASNTPNYDILAKRLIRGEIIPVLGTEALRLSQLAQKMAEEIGYDDFSGTFSMISGCYIHKEHSKGTLVASIKTLMDQENLTYKLNPIYNLIKRIEKPFILISFSYDSLWKFIFQGRKYAILSPSDKEIGKFIIKSQEDSDLRTPDEISKLNLLENGYSIIYQICGYFIPDHQEDDTLMISETDFLRLENFIPEYLIGKSRGKSFLFLGYDLEQWHDRLIAHTILKKAQYKKSAFVVTENPTLYQRTFWKDNNVDIYDVELQEFIGKMNQNQD